jgi:hypothetical protein
MLGDDELQPGTPRSGARKGSASRLRLSVGPGFTRDRGKGRRRPTSGPAGAPASAQPVGPPQGTARASTQPRGSGALSTFARIADRRRLSRSIWTHEPDHNPVGNHEREVVYRNEIPEAPGQPICGQRAHGSVIVRDEWVSRHHAFLVIMTRLSSVDSRSRLTPRRRRAHLAGWDASGAL